MTKKSPYYLTTPIYYVNDKPHIGHAYTTLACDVLARFKRLDGFDVLFLTGTDEHGQKVQQAAEKAGLTPKDFTDKVSQNFRDLLNIMNFSNDKFIRTTQANHYISSQMLWRKLHQKGHIRLGKYAGWYSVRDESFYTEAELVDGHAPTGAPVQWVEEPSYFFNLSEWQDKLLDFYESHPEFIGPDARRKEIISFVSSGLKDLSISRTTFDWGVPVPDDDGHVIYVWLDALVNYITVLNWHEDDVAFQRFWPANLHMVGKDILRFHAVYWPAFLMAADMPLPKRVFAHGWWTNEGQKISKSLKNVIDPVTLVNTYGIDQTRYFLLREVPFGRDGDFARDSMIHRINSDLSNDLGNLVQRVLSLIIKNLDKHLPVIREDYLEDADKDILVATDALISSIRTKMDQQAFHEVLRLIWEVIAHANQYIDQMAPWRLKTTDTQRMKDVLAVLVEVIRQIAILLQPFMPDSAHRLLDQIGIAETERQFMYLDRREGGIAKSYPIDTPQGIFPRFYEENDTSS